MLQNLSVFKKIMLLVIILLGFTLVGGVSNFLLVRQVADIGTNEAQKAMETGIHRALKFPVRSTAITLYELLTELPDQAAKDAMIRHLTHPVRFGEGKWGYYYCYRLNLETRRIHNVCLATLPHLVGKDLTKFKDSNRFALVAAIYAAAAANSKMITEQNANELRDSGKIEEAQRVQARVKDLEQLTKAAAEVYVWAKTELAKDLVNEKKRELEVLQNIHNRLEAVTKEITVQGAFNSILEKYRNLAKEKAEHAAKLKAEAVSTGKLVNQARALRLKLADQRILSNYIPLPSVTTVEKLHEAENTVALESQRLKELTTRSVQAAGEAHLAQAVFDAVQAVGKATDKNQAVNKVMQDSQVALAQIKTAIVEAQTKADALSTQETQTAEVANAEAEAYQSQGFVPYLYKKPPKLEVKPKIGYAEIIPGTHVMMGDGAYIDNIDDERRRIQEGVDQLVVDRVLKTLGVLGLILIFGIIPLVYLVGQDITRPLAYIANEMRKRSSKTDTESMSYCNDL